jgi:hypothetical protein
MICLIASTSRNNRWHRLPNNRFLPNHGALGRNASDPLNSRETAVSETGSRVQANFREGDLSGLGRAREERCHVEFR